MEYEVVCSDCGAKFNVKENKDVFTPSNCPKCNGIISEVIISPTSNTKVAGIKNK